MSIYTYSAKVLRVVDGDTLELEVDLGFRMKCIDRFRLEGVDTPEVYGVKHSSEEYKRGKLASQFTQDWCDKHPNGVTIKTKKTGKYGRWIAIVFAGFDCLNVKLLDWLTQQEEAGWPQLDEE